MNSTRKRSPGSEPANCSSVRNPPAATPSAGLNFFFRIASTSICTIPPARQDFSLSDRAQSHGCIRVADPAQAGRMDSRKPGLGPGTDRSIPEFRGNVEPGNCPTRQCLHHLPDLPSLDRPAHLWGKFVLARMRDVYSLDAKDTGTLAPVMP